MVSLLKITNLEIRIMRKSTPYQLLLLFVLSICWVTSAQIGIGTTTPHSSSILDVTSTSKGFLLPRMTGFERGHIQNPSVGLLIYCKDCCSQGVLSTFTGVNWINTPSCLNEDPDSDGILQNEDLDEDNDGILDAEECPFHFADFDGLGFLVPGESDKNFNSDVNGGVLPAIVTLKSPLRTDASGTNNNNTRIFTASSSGKKIGLRFSMNNIVDFGDKMESEISLSTSAKVRIVVNEVLFPILGSAINVSDEFRFTPINPTVGFNWIINDTNKAIVEMEGHTIILKGTQIGFTSGYAEFDISTNTDVDGFNVSLTHIGSREGGNSSIFAFSFGCQDTDSDGIPDYLDLDSDNDNISDAKEAGFTLSSDPEFQFGNPSGSNGVYDSLELIPDASPVLYK